MTKLSSDPRQASKHCGRNVTGKLALLCAVALLACGSDADDVPTAKPLGSEQLASIRAAVKASLGKQKATGYSVAVWRDGSVVYAEGFGTTRPSGPKVSTGTLFQIGSDTKKISAIALLQRVEKGALALDDTVSELVPELELASDPAYFKSLTVHDLLCQRSGMYDYAPFKEAAGDGQLASTVLGRFAKNQYAFMPPGLAWSYSNANYSLVGFLDEHGDGRPWADIVTKDVFAPLHMDHSYARRADMLRAEKDIASGFGGTTRSYDSFSPLELPPDGEGWVAAQDQVDNAFLRPAGLVWSTASDQARLLGFFIAGDEDVLSDELRLSMMRAQTPLNNHMAATGYGYGLIVSAGYAKADGTYYDVPYILHGGNTLNMTSGSALLPEQRVAVSVLANGENEDLTKLLATALEAAAGDRLPKPSAPPELPKPASDFASYAGEFYDPNLGMVTITWQNGNLTIDSPALTSIGLDYDTVLKPIALDLFVWTVDGAPMPIDFYDGADKTPHKYGVNRQFVLTRVEPSAASKSRVTPSASEGRRAFTAIKFGPRIDPWLEQTVKVVR
jgi:CubicO group peptidase (beta-lactamase class C family)